MDKVAVNLHLNIGCDSTYKTLDINADGRPVLWQLYTPEPDQRDIDPNMYLWVRRCRLFISAGSAIQSLIDLGITLTGTIQRHTDFRELYILKDTRGYVWYLCEATIEDAKV